MTKKKEEHDKSKYKEVDEMETQETESAEKAEETEKVEPVREPKEVTILDTELEKLQEEAAENQRKYLHLLAESENARKRMQKERGELTQYAIEQVLSEFLRPLDQMEGALGYAEKMSDEVKNWAIGFQMILTDFKNVFVDHGVVAFESKGKTFDPHWHEAVEMIETEEHPADTIVEELVKGYKKGERVIRPARVRVAKAPSVDDEAQQENKES